ncbi:MAG: hypothetical protein JW844_01575 [Candidatus Omnitrophica bacterium]|nr:hypothetical protein [Candidatus Omnitrophota bacterium]
MGIRNLVFYITDGSGHHQAALALSNAIRKESPSDDVLTMNCFHYTNPVLEKIVRKSYLNLIRTTPEVWEFLYDNHRIYRKIRQFRHLIHTYNSPVLGVLLRDYRPDMVVCTQAFPCGLLADLKRSHAYNGLLVGVLTDFASHCYWVYDEVDYYIVHHNATKAKLVNQGVDSEKILTFGIPIDPVFSSRSVDCMRLYTELNFSKESFTILLTGGGRGVGSLEKAAHIIDSIDAPVQLMVVVGTNHALYRRLCRRKWRKPVRIFGYVNNMHMLMRISSIVISKAGGLTVAEALSLQIPLIIVSPIPGQEENNSTFLTSQGCAFRVNAEEELIGEIKKIISQPSILQGVKKNMSVVSRPDAAVTFARYFMNRVSKEAAGVTDGYVST